MEKKVRNKIESDFQLFLDGNLYVSAGTRDVGVTKSPVSYLLMIFIFTAIDNTTDWSVGMEHFLGWDVSEKVF